MGDYYAMAIIGFLLLCLIALLAKVVPTSDTQVERAKARKARHYHLHKAFHKLRVACAVSAETRVFNTVLSMSRVAFCLQQRAFWGWQPQAGAAGAALS